MKYVYVKEIGEEFYIAGSRISLESVILAFLAGFSPKTIAAECYPTLSLEQVYGAITYYLSIRQENDNYLKENENDWHKTQEKYQDPEFLRKMAQALRNVQPV